MNEFKEPWVVYPQASGNEHARVYTAAGKYIGVLHGEAISTADEEAYCSRVADCVNFLAGVPSQKLKYADPQAKAMFLACFAGDDTAALAWADEVQEKSRNDGYVPRSEIVKANGTLGAMVGKLRKELRHLRVRLVQPRSQEANPKTVIYSYPEIVALLVRIDRVLAQTDRGDPGPEES